MFAVQYCLGVRLGALELRQLCQNLVRNMIHTHIAILIGAKWSHLRV
jgi:hypothetical protein